jgi:mannose-6-phosphate isomerase-like protein (cupin superfamily)
MQAINLAEKLALIPHYWQPHVIGELNENELKLVKLHGEFVWHHHEAEDELFIVLQGRLLMQFRDRDVYLNPGEILVVPKGVEHRPVANEGEVHVMLVEPKGTRNTGNLENERTFVPKPI